LPSLRRKTTSRAEEEERTGTRRGVGVAASLTATPGLEEAEERRPLLLRGSSSSGAEARDDEAGEAPLTGDLELHRPWMSFSKLRAATALCVAARLGVLS
jgi:hypothetical protein